MIISNVIPNIGRVRFVSVPNFKANWKEFTFLNSISVLEMKNLTTSGKSLLLMEIECNEQPIGFIQLKELQQKNNIECQWSLLENFQWVGIEAHIIESMADFLMTIEKVTELKFTTLEKINDEINIRFPIRKKLLDNNTCEFTIVLDHKRSAKNW